MHLIVEPTLPQACCLHGSDFYLECALMIPEKKLLWAPFLGWLLHKVSVCGQEDLLFASGDIGKDPPWPWAVTLGR